MMGSVSSSGQNRKVNDWVKLGSPSPHRRRRQGSESPYCSSDAVCTDLQPPSLSVHRLLRNLATAYCSKAATSFISAMSLHATTRTAFLQHQSLCNTILLSSIVNLFDEGQAIKCAELS